MRESTTEKQGIGADKQGIGAKRSNAAWITQTIQLNKQGKTS